MPETPIPDPFRSVRHPIGRARRRSHKAVLPLVLAWLVAGVADAQQRLLDAAAQPAVWKAIASDGVTASVTAVDCDRGRALRLSYDFAKGSGYCILRREISLELPENYAFALTLRGQGLPNNLEFKLVSPDGNDVWWDNRREYEPSAGWSTLTSKRRHFSFAWGPSGGTPLRRIGAIEFAVAAAGGGAGWVEFQDLTFEPLPAVAGSERPAILRFLSAGSETRPPAPLTSADLDWRTGPGDRGAAIELAFDGPREIGGLALAWGEPCPPEYEILATAPGRPERSLGVFRPARGGRDTRILEPVEAQAIRIVPRPSSGEGAALRGLRILPVEVAESANDRLAAVAADAPPGWYPVYFRGQARPWTILGVPQDENEALIDVAGSIELGKKGPRVEPLLVRGAKASTAADVRLSQALADESLPIPSVTWTTDAFTLGITAFADGAPGESRIAARYEVRAAAGQPFEGALYLMFRPYQVLPPWQQLNFSGGAARVRRALRNDQLILLDDRWPILPWTKFEAFGATGFDSGDIVEFAARDTLPPDRAAEDPAGLASAAVRYPVRLAGGQSAAFFLTIPLHRLAEDDPCGRSAGEAAAVFERRLAAASEAWRAATGRMQMTLPQAVQPLERCYRTGLAHILITADGPAIQPGARTYERSWIRDGAISSTALLQAGELERVRAYLDWYCRYQYETGKVPCVVDRRGPDPVNEHDSTGELLHAIWTCYRYCRDREWLAARLPNVVAGVDYLDSLRRQRMTAEFRDGPPEKRVLYGLVPESISHEGYSAKPMHSYWDSFWTMRGLADAAAIARVLDRGELAGKFTALRDEYSCAVRESILLAARLKGVGYIPGCAELGDFDATSTAVAFFPCDVAQELPPDLLRGTFDRYMQFFRDRRDGRLAWKDYTPYEIRLTHAFLRLGRPDDVHELLDFFLRDQSPPGWNQWAEVVHRDPLAPRFIGDLPHTWVGAEYVTSFRNLFVYESAHDDRLVLAAGVQADWLARGEPLAIRDWPTAYGTISYRLSQVDRRLGLEVSGRWLDEAPAVDFRIPGSRAIKVLRVNGAEARPGADRTVRLQSIDAQVEIEFE